MRTPHRPSIALLALAAAAGLTSALARPAEALQSRAIAQAGDPSGTTTTIEALRRDGRSKGEARRFGEAIRDYERLLALAPGDADALAHLAQLQAWTGDHDKAIVLYREAVARQPLDLGLQSDLADVLTWANRPEEAERLYEPVLARDGHHHEALKGLARARLLRGDTASAAAVIDRALELYPKDVDLHAARARMLSQKGQLDGAIQALKRAVQLAPSDADVLSLLAETYQQKQDWPNAQETWLRVAQLAPNAPESHVALGRVYLALGKLSLAREHAALALRMSPTGAAANQLMTELDREARLAPVRTATDWFELLAYVALLPVMLLVARRSRRSLRRQRTAWTFAVYVVPGFLVLGVLAHSIKGMPWGWFDGRVFGAVSDMVLLLGLGVAFVAALRLEPRVREFEGEVVLALGAHPDDIELGCGGLLLKLKASGARVHGLTLTRGERGTDRHGQREVAADVEQHRHVGPHRHETHVGQGEHAGPQCDVHRQRQQGVDAELRQQELMGAVEAERVTEELDEELHADLRPAGRRCAPGGCRRGTPRGRGTARRRRRPPTRSTRGRRGRRPRRGPAGSRPPRHPGSIPSRRGR